MGQAGIQSKVRVVDAGSSGFSYCACEPFPFVGSSSLRVSRSARPRSDDLFYDGKKSPEWPFAVCGNVRLQVAGNVHSHGDFSPLYGRGIFPIVSANVRSCWNSTHVFVGVAPQPHIGGHVATRRHRPCSRRLCHPTGTALGGACRTRRDSIHRHVLCLPFVSGRVCDASKAALASSPFGGAAHGHDDVAV